jgi:putative membrane protein
MVFHYLQGTQRWHDIFSRYHLNSIQMKNKIKIAFLALAICAMYQACKDDDDDNNSNGNNNTGSKSIDSIFVAKVSMGNSAEIQLGSLVSTHSNDSAIKWFGNMMVSDHTTAQASLTSLANSLSMYAPDSLDSAHVALKAQLMSLNGNAFDSVYIHNMVIDHQQTVSLFQNQIANGIDAQIKNYASTNLPIIQMHLDEADSLASFY